MISEFDNNSNLDYTISIVDKQLKYTMTVSLFDHQVGALNAVISSFDEHGNTSGRVVIPTGGGKTFIEAAIINHQINNRIVGYTATQTVLAPRILLARK